MLYVFRRERHAKTLEIAQEEVLTCLGLFLYERLQRIHTRMREEEQTWDILFHVALDTLKRNFEVRGLIVLSGMRIFFLYLVALPV